MTRKFLSTLTILTVIVAFSALGSCYYDSEEDLYGSTTTVTCDTTGSTFAAFVSPLISSKCASSGCHNAASQAAGINLGNYTAIKAYITSSKAAFVGSINHSSGFSAMPKGSSKMAACDIKKVETWINAGMLNN